MPCDHPKIRVHGNDRIGWAQCEICKQSIRMDEAFNLYMERIEKMLAKGDS